MAAVLYDTLASYRTLSSGIDKLSNCVIPTFGPKGRNAAYDQKDDIPLVVNTGRKLLKDFQLSEPLENMPVEILKAVAAQTTAQTGDGGTATILMAQTIFKDGIKNVAAGADPLALRRGMERAVSAVCSYLQTIAEPVTDTVRMQRICEIAAGSNTWVGQLLTEAFEKVGLDGVITVEDSQLRETSMYVSDGASFEGGMLSSYFINTKKDTCKLNNPYILVCNRKIDDPKDILKLMQQVNQEDGALLIIARELSQEVLGVLAANVVRGSLKAAAVLGPGHGETRRRNMQALAARYDAVLMEDANGISLRDSGLEICGRAEKVILSRERTALYQPLRTRQTEADSLRQFVRQQLSGEADEYEREKLQQTLAILNGGVASIRVGGVSELEMFEKKFLIENSLRSAYTARQSGAVLGGGVALLRASAALSELLQMTDGDERTGVQILRDALKAPTRQIADNAGADGSAVVARILAENRIDFGFDAASLTFCDFRNKGIWDPLQTVCAAIENGTSAAATLLTVGKIVLKD